VVVSQLASQPAMQPLMGLISFKTFLDNLASLAANKRLAVIPCHDRQLLAARSPPRVNFPHPEMVKLDDLPSGIGHGIFEASLDELDFNVIGNGGIYILKEKQHH
jgi:hypothetical protein